LLVHEAYACGFDAPGHAQVRDVLNMASTFHVKRLALTHHQRDVRRTRLGEIRVLIRQSNLDVFIPEPGDVVEV